MTGIEVARKVVEEKQNCLFRARRDEPGQYDVKEPFTGKRSGWTYLDLFSASAIIQVYDAVSETNKAKFSGLPIAKMASVAFKLINKE